MSEPAAPLPTPIESWEVLDLLAGLVHKSLAVYEEDEQGQGRYRLLEPMRQYARDRLLESGEATEARGRHRDWFVALAERVEPALFGREQAAWLERLETEHDNLRAALECSVESGEAEAGLRLAGAVWRFWHVRRYREEGQELLMRLLARPEAAGQTAVRAKALDRTGILAITLGDLEAARCHFEEMMVIGQALGDRRIIAAALNGLSQVALYNDDRATARSHCEESLAISRELGDRWNAAFSLFALGNVQVDDRAARVYHEESLALFRQLEDSRGITMPLYSLARTTLTQGDHEAARSFWGECLAISRELGEMKRVMECLAVLGEIAQEQGDYEAARSFYRECLAMQRQKHEKSGVAWILTLLALLARRQGDYESAGSLFEESLALQRELGNRADIAGSLLILGLLATSQGDFVPARCRHLESLTIGRELGSHSVIANALEGFADLAVAQGQAARAARVFGAAAGLREVMGARLPPADRAEHDRSVATIRSALGEEAFAAGWAMPLEDAIQFALEEREPS